MADKMTAEEIINGLHNLCYNLSTGGNGHTYDIYGICKDSAILIETLQSKIKELEEKQTEMKVKKSDYGYELYGCPNCDYTDSLWSVGKRDKHCPNCGQALDWSVENE